MYDGTVGGIQVQNVMTASQSNCETVYVSNLNRCLLSRTAATLDTPYCFTRNYTHLVAGASHATLDTMSLHATHTLSPAPAMPADAITRKCFLMGVANLVGIGSNGYMIQRMGSNGHIIQRICMDG
jgi:hypothetical protein